MSPTAKDIDVTNPSPTAPGARPAVAGTHGEEGAGRPQPVPLEVPVTVNGARTLEGSDKREPFFEATQTVLVFANGAVIRLASTVAAGQLLFLTNDKTKKEVVCQVVKSKNYRNVSGYVELEFTEAVPGFWGMRFPSATVQPTATPPAPAAKLAAPKIEAHATSSAPPRVELKAAPNVAAPARTATTTSSALNLEAKIALNLPRVAEAKSVTTFPGPAVSPANTGSGNAAVNVVHSNIATSSSPGNPPSNVALKPAPEATHNDALPKAPGLTDGWGTGLTSSARPAESKPSAPVVPKLPAGPTAIHAQPETDALRRESERLQEKLASMLFAAEVPATPVHAAPVPPTAKTSSLPESSAKVVEMTRPQTPDAKAVPPAPKASPIKLVPSLHADEVKIPSWLEPLARNAATHAQPQSAAKDDSATNAERVIEFEVQDVSAPAAHKEEIPAAAEPVFETHLVEDAAAIRPRGAAKGSNKATILFAVAAGFVVAAVGGTWYWRQSVRPAQPSPTAITEPAALGDTASATPPAARGGAITVAPNRSNINSEPVAQSQNSASQPGSGPSSTPEAQFVKASPEKNTAAELSAYKKLAEPQPVAPAEGKRPSLGEVHLSAPTANRNAVTAAGGEAEALSLNAGETAPTGDAFGAGLVAGNSKQPAAPPAPLPIGGDVKAARLLSSAPPIYPVLAKAQNIEGAVVINALVDATGKVSSMKVVSGPVLLHQAAMDAVRQWKYQAATLDGKTVPMRLTVTVQFHLR